MKKLLAVLFITLLSLTVSPVEGQDYTFDSEGTYTAYVICNPWICPPDGIDQDRYIGTYFRGDSEVPLDVTEPDVNSAGESIIGFHLFGPSTTYADYVFTYVPADGSGDDNVVNGDGTTLHGYWTPFNESVIIDKPALSDGRCNYQTSAQYTANGITPKTVGSKAFEISVKVEITKL